MKNVNRKKAPNNIIVNIFCPFLQIFSKPVLSAFATLQPICTVLYINSNIEYNNTLSANLLQSIKSPYCNNLY